jgi:hypothetical protein
LISGELDKKLTEQAGSSEIARVRLNCASAVVKRDVKTKRLENFIIDPDVISNGIR